MRANVILASGPLLDAITQHETTTEQSAVSTRLQQQQHTRARSTQQPGRAMQRTKSGTETGFAGAVAPDAQRPGLAVRGRIARRRATAARPRPTCDTGGERWSGGGGTQRRCCVHRVWWHECVRAGAASHVWVQAQRTEKGQRARSEPRTEAEPQRGTADGRWAPACASARSAYRAVRHCHVLCLRTPLV